MSLKAFLPFACALLLAQSAAAAGVFPAGTAAAEGPGKAGAEMVGNGAPDSAAVGRWREHELSFTYSGFTTKYSCDGLADKVRGLLRALGARADLKVVTYGCSSLSGGPTEFPRVKLRFAALEPFAAAPADQLAPGGKPATLPGAWRAVRFDRDRPRPLEPGDCELLEQFRDRVLPLFTLRGMDDHVRCIPYQLSGTSLALAFEVFAPVAAADTVRAGRR